MAAYEGFLYRLYIPKNIHETAKLFPPVVNYRLNYTIEKNKFPQIIRHGDII
jgi:hypothetical protein